jgi:hypothetical protein
VHRWVGSEGSGGVPAWPRCRPCAAVVTTTG